MRAPLPSPAETGTLIPSPDPSKHTHREKKKAEGEDSGAAAAQEEASAEPEEEEAGNGATVDPAAVRAPHTLHFISHRLHDCVAGCAWQASSLVRFGMATGGGCVHVWMACAGAEAQRRDVGCESPQRWTGTGSACHTHGTPHTTLHMAHVVAADRPTCCAHCTVRTACNHALDHAFLRHHSRHSVTYGLASFHTPPGQGQAGGSEEEE